MKVKQSGSCGGRRVGYVHFERCERGGARVPGIREVVQISLRHGSALKHRVHKHGHRRAPSLALHRAYKLQWAPLPPLASDTASVPEALWKALPALEERHNIRCSGVRAVYPARLDRDDLTG